MAKPKRPQERTLAEKLDHLFATVHPADRGEYTYEEVATAVAQQGGPTISAAYIWQLRNGKRDNPTKRHIEALAKFFGVPPAYFLSDEEARRIDAELDLLAAMRDSSIRQIMLRSGEPSPQGREAIRRLIDDILAIERPGREKGSTR
jgi:transcriptional regulator with XRE-family HTH domain